MATELEPRDIERRLVLLGTLVGENLWIETTNDRKLEIARKFLAEVTAPPNLDHGLL